VLAKIDGTNYNTEWVNVEGDYLPLAGGAMNTGAEVTISDGYGHDSALDGWGLGIELSSDHAQGTTVEYNGLNVYNGTDTINVTPTAINLTNSDTTKHTNITTSYINITDDNNSYNVQLADGTIILTNGGTDTVLSINSNTGITFEDNTVQNTAFVGFNNAALTGIPTAPSASLGDDSTQIATTAFVQDAIIGGSAHAETLVANVRNNTGSSLPAFTVVYITGAVGNKAAVAKAQANSEATSSGTFAVTETAIANNANGNVISAGVLSGVNTSAFTDGDMLYLSPTVAGAVTTTKPSAPNHAVFIGVVTRSHVSLGTVSVRIQNGFNLEELHNVAIASVADKDSLFYESSTSLWKNYTPANARTNLGLGTASTLASTAVAQTANNLSDLASASTARTNLGLGTMATQSSATYATVASPTFTGTVTIPSGASISGFAPLASPSLTGTPLSTTASVSTNTTQIATTAFVLGQAGTGTPIVDGTAAVGTSLLYARQDHVHPTDTSRAALASPTFTGTPTLPTGTIATTQTAGNNTTAVATTAFVTAAVPAFATDAQAATGTSTTVSITPANMAWSNKPSSLQGMQFNASAAVTAGGGSAALNSGTYLCQAASTAISTGMMYIYTISVNRGTSATAGFNWAKAFSATFRFNEASVVTDANTISRVLFGKNYGTAGDLTAVGVGIKKSGSGYFSLLVHNGTTLTTVASTISTTATYNDFRITSDGAGNVKLYINDVLECTTSAGPTTQVSQGLYITQESQNTAIVTAPGSNTRLTNLRYEFAV